MSTNSTEAKNFARTNFLLHPCYFLNVFSEEYVHPKLKLLPREEVLDKVMAIVPKVNRREALFIHSRADSGVLYDRITELGLDKEKLTNWADLAYSLHSFDTRYEPTGIVKSIDVFCAIPLAAVAKDMEDWKTNHLAKWAEFSKMIPRLHEVDGAYYTMLSPMHVYLFQRS